MVTLSNKRVAYAVNNSNETIKITGNVNILEDGRISDFSGQFKDVDDTYIGSFYYNENENGRVNKNINDLVTSNSVIAGNLLDTTIEEIKTKVSTNDNE